MKLFALDASRAFAEQLAGSLGVELAAHEERVFEDTEFKVRPLESVRGERAFVCQSLFAGAGGSASDKLLRLLVLIGALADAGAATVVAVTPYLAYARKDRRTKPRDPVTTRYVAALFEAVGAGGIVTMDVHNAAAFENAFRRPTENLGAAALFAGHFAGLGAAGRLVVLSPDAGGVKRAKEFADLLQARTGAPVQLAFMEKQRSGGVVSGEAFAGDVGDATVIIIDDVISGGTTLARAAAACAARGARSIHAAATHGILAAGAAETLAAVPQLESVAVTDTIGDVRERGAALGRKLTVLEAAPPFADALRRWTR